MICLRNSVLILITASLVTFFSCTTTELDVKKAENKADAAITGAYNRADEVALEAENQEVEERLAIEGETDAKIQSAYQKAEETEMLQLQKIEETRRDAFVDSTAKQLQDRRSELKSLTKSKARSNHLNQNILDLQGKITQLEEKLQRVRELSWESWEEPSMEIAQSLAHIDSRYRKLVAAY